MGLENMARAGKQDIIFSILKTHAKGGEDIFGDGVLEILQDGFGFLRSADSSYLAGPDDIYVSPSQIRRFNLRTGDTIAGKIRPPKDSERYFALLKIREVNFDGVSPARSQPVKGSGYIALAGVGHGAVNHFCGVSSLSVLHQRHPNSGIRGLSARHTVHARHPPGFGRAHPCPGRHPLWTTACANPTLD